MNFRCTGFWTGLGRPKNAGSPTSFKKKKSKKPEKQDLKSRAINVFLDLATVHSSSSQALCSQVRTLQTKSLWNKSQQTAYCCPMESCLLAMSDTIFSSWIQQFWIQGAINPQCTIPLVCGPKKHHWCLQKLMNPSELPVIINTLPLVTSCVSEHPFVEALLEWTIRVNNNN